jgi:hypothetical protein
MPTWAAILIGVCGCTGIFNLVTVILQHRWSRQEKKDERIDALVEAQMVIMVDRVRFLGRAYIKEGRISLSDKENLHGMYRAYKVLGGNGHLETVMDEVDNLEVRG